MNHLLERKALSLLMDALDLPGGSRESFVASQCGDDHELLSRVTRLLHRARDGRALPELRVTVLGDQGTPMAPHAQVGAGRRLRSLSESLLGQRLGEFRLLEVLGEGGMGVVFLAEQDVPRREVALKVLHGHVLGDGEMVRRFQREAEFLGRLEHPGIARVYGVGDADVDGGLIPFLAMERIKGRSTRSFIADEDPTLEVRVQLAARIADAVQYAHGRGVLHRDLKPSNILVTADGQPKVLDFGIATTLDLDQAEGSDAGKVIGTLAYMSPEQARGQNTDLDARSDVYSLGLIAYEIFLGEPAFSAEGSRLSVVLGSFGRGEPPRLESREASLRGDLSAIVAKACRRDACDRYPTVQAFGDDLRAYLERRPVAARAQSGLYQVQMFMRRNRSLVGLGAVAVVAVLLGVLMLADGLRRSRASEKRALVSLARSEAFKNVQSGLLSVDRIEGIRNQLDERLRRELLSSIPDGASGADFAVRPFIESSLNSARLFDLVDAVLNVAIYEPAVDSIDRLDDPSAALEAELRESLAPSMAEIGRYEEAKEQQDRAFELRVESGDTLSSDYIRCVMLKISIDIEADPSMQTLQEALDLLRETRERIGGVQSASDLLALKLDHFHAALLRRSGRLADAEQISRAVLAAREELLAPNHRQTMTSMNNLILNLLDLGDAEAGLEMALDLAERSKGAYPYGSIHSLRNRSTLAKAWAAVGESRKALAILDELVPLCVSGRGVRDRRTLAVRMERGLVLMAHGRFEDALAELEDVLHKREARGNTKSILLTESKIAVARCRLAMDEPAEALAVLKNALRQVKGPKPHLIRQEIELRLLLGFAYLHLGDGAEATASLEESVELSASVHGPDPRLRRLQAELRSSLGF